MPGGSKALRARSLAACTSCSSGRLMRAERPLRWYAAGYRCPIPISIGRDAGRVEGAPRAELGCLHELFERQADARGEAVALVCGRLSLSYSDLELRANRLANHLRQLGIGRGALVGIAIDRSELPIIAVLACLKAGAAYVPVDPGHPDERIRFIIEEAEIAALLTERAQLARMSALFG